MRKELVVACLVLAGLTATVHAKDSVRVTSEATYPAGSSEAQQVRTWLHQNASQIDGRPLGDFTRLGNLKVTVTTPDDGRLGGMTPGSPPPVPLPPSGRHGQVISVSSNHGGTQQTWTYQWVSTATGGGWVLVGYTFTLRPPVTTRPN